MNEPQQETRYGKSSIDGGGGGIGGGINFIGADGSVLDNLPSGMEAVMDPDAICSLDYSLASLTSLSPPPGEGHGQQDGGGSWQPRSSTADDGPPPPTATATAGTTVAAVARTTTAAAAAAAAAGPKRARAEAGRASSERIASSGPNNRHNGGSRDRDEDTNGRGGGLEAGETNGRGAAGYGHRSMTAKARGGKKRRKGGDDAGDGDGDGDRDDPDFDGGGGKAAGGEDEDANENPKQRANRVRNREHARNTRIRKKQYVESLKLQVGEMLQAKAQEERDAQLETSKISAERTAMRQMVLNILYLKATEELSPRSWACVLDDGFTCVCPITPFRSFPPAEAREDHRLITGIEGMIQDTASLAVFIKSICPRSRNPTGRKLKYQFYTSPEDTVVGPNALMCQWLMKTDNATECGALCDVFSHGMLRAHFSPDNRIKRLEIVFDVMSLMQQLQRAVGQGELRMVPNTLALATQPSQQARLVLSAVPPYGITHTNEAWTALMGHTAEEAKMFPFTLMNGPAEANNGDALETLVQTCIGSSVKRAEMVDLSVVTRDLRRLAVAVQAYPLGTPDGATTHLLLVMEEIPVCTPLPQAGLDLYPFV